MLLTAYDKSIINFILVENMNFWQIIEENVTNSLNISDANRQLETALITLPAEDIQAFCNEFIDKMNEAYTWDLWGVAYLINGGCSDDSFTDFRASLIALGKEIFETAIADAEILMTLETQQIHAMFNEGFSSIGNQAYKTVTGQPFLTNKIHQATPSGIEWDESAESLKIRFPNTWAVYGWPDTKQTAVNKIPWWKFW